MAALALCVLAAAGGDAGSAPTVLELTHDTMLGALNRHRRIVVLIYRGKKCKARQARAEAPERPRDVEMEAKLAAVEEALALLREDGALGHLVERLEQERRDLQARALGGPL